MGRETISRPTPQPAPGEETMNWKKERIRRHKISQRKKYFRGLTQQFKDATDEYMRNFASTMSIQRMLLNDSNESVSDKSSAE